jgi:hypothetical protein
MVEASTRKGEIRLPGEFKLFGLHFYCKPLPQNVTHSRNTVNDFVYTLQTLKPDDVFEPDE